ncbi:hypothetical protein JL721_5068 [Aureococcus anophagefferens]|nr:hypothetical protein JL721_5068 [Aureococcus anophagefferens]
MEHLNPVTGSPLRVGPHGGDMQPRAYGSSVDAEYFDARQLETEVLSHNAQVIRDRERPTAESEEEVLEWGRTRGVSVVGPEGRSEEQPRPREHELLVLRDREARAARLEKERDDERREDEKRLRQASSFLPPRERPARPADDGSRRRPSANGRGSKLGDIISYDGGRAGGARARTRLRTSAATTA